ncbi:cell wall hydrolase [bacterium]|nr:cell wall hydrolase [bacterium]
MSEAERRLAQQRAVSIAACAAAAAVGGPLIGYRVDVQKVDEAYIAEAVTLAGKLDTNSVIQPDVSDRARGWLQPASYALADASRGILDISTARVRDNHSIARLTSFDARHFEGFEGSEADMKCLAEAVYYEARSEGVKGQIAVAEVVLNRVADPNFPNTICGVVYQGAHRVTGCQFTFTCDGSLRYRPRGPLWERAKAVALHVKLGFGAPVTNSATHYHATYVDPYWSPGMVQTAHIGMHVFYRFPKTAKEWRYAQVALAERRARDEVLVYASGEELQPGDIVIAPGGSDVDVFRAPPTEATSTAL